MIFNATTRRLEGLAGTGASGNFGFEKGTREDIWMQNTEYRLRNRFGVSPKSSKKEKIVSEARIAELLNRAYDFVFWLDDHNVDFYPVTQPRETIYIQIQTNDKGDTQLVSEIITCQYLPVDDVLRRLEANLREVVALGPMEPLDIDSETNEATAWKLLAAPIRSDRVEAEAAATRIR